MKRQLQVPQRILLVHESESNWGFFCVILQLSLNLFDFLYNLRLGNIIWWKNGDVVMSNSFLIIYLVYLCSLCLLDEYALVGLIW